MTKRAIVHRLPGATDREATPPDRLDPSRHYPWNFVIMSTPAIRSLARRIRTATALRLFLVLPSILDWQEWRQLRQADLAEELEIAQPHISTALKELLELGILERRGSGPRQEWRLSLDTGWRGNVAEYWEEATKKGKKPGGGPGRPTASSRRRDSGVTAADNARDREQKAPPTQRTLKLLRALPAEQEKKNG